MKNVLFQCNTTYQIIVAYQLSRTIYKDYSADIIISDIMNNSKKIYERISGGKWFNNVYFQSVKDCRISKMNKILLKIKLELNLSAYDEFCFANASIFNLYIVKQLRKKNKLLKVNLFEDGLSTYSKFMEREVLFNSQIHNINGVVFRQTYKYLRNIKTVYVFNLEYFCWTNKEKIQLQAIPKIDADDEELKNELNRVFNYNSKLFPDDCTKIFFEESYFADGKDVNDIEIINKIIDKFGVEGFYVKRHPRNAVNRFEDLGIKQLNTDSIPWELFILNNYGRINDMQFFSIASSAMYNQAMLFSLKAKSYACRGMLKDKTILVPYINEVEDLVLSRNTNFVVLK